MDFAIRISIARTARPSAVVGVPAGLAAGVAYLTAQVIAAILLGPDALPPPGEWSGQAIGTALVIHLGLSIVYGMLADVLVMRSLGLVRAALLGALFGALLFVVNRLLIAPVVFPWFDASRNAFTAMNHVLFGVVAALLCVTLRRHFAMKKRL